jgi:hypothetical protein
MSTEHRRPVYYLTASKNLPCYGDLQLYGGRTNKTTFARATGGSDYTLTYPNAVGVANQALMSDASGTLSWNSVGVTGVPGIGLITMPSTTPTTNKMLLTDSPTSLAWQSCNMPSVYAPTLSNGSGVSDLANAGGGAHWRMGSWGLVTGGVGFRSTVAGSVVLVSFDMDLPFSGTNFADVNEVRGSVSLWDRDTTTSVNRGAVIQSKPGGRLVTITASLNTPAITDDWFVGFTFMYPI